MRFVTDFADAAIILPLVIALWAVLGARGTRWAVATSVTLGAVLALKALCFQLTRPQPFSPSGHTASAAIVYGGLAWVLLRPRLGPVAPALIAIALVTVIGITRLSINVHSLTEVLAGGALGMAGLAWLAQAVPVPGRVWPAFATTGVAWAALHGRSLGIEEGLRGVILGW